MESNDEQEEESSGEEQKLEPDVKEKAQANSLFEKVFQRQIQKLKTLKGVGEYGKPSKKDNGFLSIEKVKLKDEKASSPIVLVYRNFMGMTQFSGVINQSISKLKELNDKPNKFRVKMVVAVKNPLNNKFESEHLEISFLTAQDRETFLTVFAHVVKHQDE